MKCKQLPREERERLVDAPLELLNEPASLDWMQSGMKRLAGAWLRMTGLKFLPFLAKRCSRRPGQSPGESTSFPASMLVKGFPFGIAYRATDTELLVVAVSPHRRRPGYWQASLSDG